MSGPEHGEVGQAAVEFIVITLLVGLVLISPWMNGLSPAEHLLEAFTRLGSSLQVWWAWS